MYDEICCITILPEAEHPPFLLLFWKYSRPGNAVSPPSTSCRDFARAPKHSGDDRAAHERNLSTVLSMGVQSKNSTMFIRRPKNGAVESKLVENDVDEETMTGDRDVNEHVRKTNHSLRPSRGLDQGDGRSLSRSSWTTVSSASVRDPVGRVSLADRLRTSVHSQSSPDTSRSEGEITQNLHMSLSPRLSKVRSTGPPSSMEFHVKPQNDRQSSSGKMTVTTTLNTQVQSSLGTTSADSKPSNSSVNGVCEDADLSLTALCNRISRLQTEAEAVAKAITYTTQDTNGTRSRPSSSKSEASRATTNSLRANLIGASKCALVLSGSTTQPSYATLRVVEAPAHNTQQQSQEQPEYS